MLANFFIKTLNNIWPMLFIFTVILVSVRVMYVLWNNQKFVFHKELLTLLFIIYLLLLYYIVTFQDNNYGTNNFIPFKEIFRYSIFSSLFIKNVLGNILLFVPFGIFVSYYIEKNSIFPTLFLSIVVSGSIEFAQSLIGRTADIDDVILNIIGGVLGYTIYKYGKKTINYMPKFAKSQIFLDCIALFSIIAIIYSMFRFNFWRFFS